MALFALQFRLFSQSTIKTIQPEQTEHIPGHKGAEATYQIPQTYQRRIRNVDKKDGGIRRLPHQRYGK